MTYSTPSAFRPCPLRPLLLQFLLCVATLAAPAALRAAKPGRDVGLRLLQAQLPANASLRRLDCEQLARAVRAATLAHRKEVVPILVAALSLDEWNARRQEEDRLSCVCVVRLFHSAATAAPERAVTLLETTEALFPDCADGLTAALRGMERGAASIAATTTNGANGADGAGNASQDGDAGAGPGTAGGVALNGPGVGEGGLGGGNGFGAGMGPGFPGAPSFGGSAPGAGFALPLPIQIAVTSVVND